MSIPPHSEPAPTLEEVWQLFRETDRKFQETDRKFQETDRKFQETDRQFKETDRKFQETDRKFQETDRQFKETDRRLREIGKKIGELGNRLGEFVENFVKPAVVRLFRERGLEVHKVVRDVEANNQELKLATQIDLLVINSDSCVLVEVKSNLSQDDVNDHLERMRKFKLLFPEYADKKAFGAVAGIAVADNVAKYAYRQGFFVIAQKGDDAVILNDAKFQPTAW